MFRKKRLWLILGLVVTLGLCMVVGQLAYNAVQSSITQAGWQRVAVEVPIGRSRVQVLATMGDIGWGHYECARQSLSGDEILEDVFLFGSKDVDQMGVVIIHYDGSSPEYAVASRSSVEGYRLRTVLWGCAPLSLLDS